MPATTLTAAPRKRTASELLADRKQLVHQLATGTDEAALAYAAQMARFAANARRVHGVFKRWSAHNFLLVAAQTRGCRHVGLYAGVAQWRSLHRELLPGARPACIWVPVTGRRDDVAEEETVTRFTTGVVYDYTDTRSLDPDFVEPSWETPLAVGDQRTLDRLVAAAGAEVRFADFGGRPETGYLTARGFIAVDDSPHRTVANKIATLCHELVHLQMGHLARISAAPGDRVAQVRADCEAEAALGEWLLLKMLGLDESVGNEVTAAAASYLRSWTAPGTGQPVEGHKARVRLLTARLEEARVAAEAILDRYLAVLP